MTASPTHLLIVQEPTNNITAGSPITVKVEALSASGQVVDPTSGSLNYTLSYNPTGAALTGTLSNTASNGVITMTGRTINQAGDDYSLTISGSINGITLPSVTTSSFNVAKGTPAVLTWTGDGPNSYWSTPTNWNLDRAPITGDSLVFPNGANRLSNWNNMTGLSLAGITISGSNYDITLVGAGAMDLGAIVYTGSNDRLTLPNYSTLTGNVNDSGASNFLYVASTTIPNTPQYLEVSAGNTLTINYSGGINNSRAMFVGAGAIVVDGAGTVLFNSDYTGNGTNLDYNTCYTVLEAGTMDIGPRGGPTDGMFYNPAPWGLVILGGGTFGEAGETALPDLLLSGKVTFTSAVNVTGNVYLNGPVYLTLDNADCDFCTTYGSGLVDYAAGAHIYLYPAYVGAAATLTVPYEQVAMVTAAQYATVGKDVSNPG